MDVDFGFWELRQSETDSFKCAGGKEHAFTVGIIMEIVPTAPYWCKYPIMNWAGMFVY